MCHPFLIPMAATWKSRNISCSQAPPWQNLIANELRVSRVKDDHLKALTFYRVSKPSLFQPLLTATLSRLKIIIFQSHI